MQLEELYFSYKQDEKNDYFFSKIFYPDDIT